MFGQHVVVQIVKAHELEVGDSIIFSDSIVKIRHNGITVFIGENNESVSKRFLAYYKVIELGDRMKIDNWKKRLTQ